jgi:hypothetical protein
VLLLLLLSGENTRLIPCHGPGGSRAELVAYRTMLATVQGRLAALKAQGFTLPQVLKARPRPTLRPPEARDCSPAIAGWS